MALLLPHLNTTITEERIRLDKPYEFTEENFLVTYRVNLEEKTLDQLTVQTDPDKQVMLWSTEKVIASEMEQLLTKRVNDFIQIERIVYQPEVSKIRPYLRDLMSSKHFKELRELENACNDRLKTLMKYEAIKFINEHVDYHMPQIVKLDGRTRMFNSVMYYDKISQSLSVLQGGDNYIPIGHVSLTFTLENV